jgi:hypothetical protein
MNKIEALCLAGDILDTVAHKPSGVPSVDAQFIALVTEIQEQFILIEKALKESEKSWSRGFDIGYAEAESDSIRAIRENY